MPKDKTASVRTPVARPAGRFFRILRSPHTLPIAALGVLVVILFAPFLFSDKVLYGSDILGNLDGRVFYRDALVRYGQFPTWFSSRLGGMPSVDASFGDAMYPPSLLLHALFPVHRALGLKIVLHVLLAGVFFYVLLYCGFRAPPLVAFAGAAFYMLNPQFVSLAYSGHEGKMFVTAWLPYVVWRTRVLLGRPGLLNATWVALGIAMCLLTPHVQLTYFMLWGLFLYWVLYAVLAWREQRTVKALVRPTLFFWVAVGLGLGMAFISFYPAYQFVRDAHSVRGVDRGFEFASSWSLHWPEFFSLWVPEFGNWLGYYWSENAFKLNTEYAGAVLCPLAVLAVVRKRSPWRVFWASIALLAVLYSLGRHTPVFHLAYYLVPGVKKFRACSMMMFWFSFAMVLLATRYLCDLVSGEALPADGKARTRWRKGLVVALALATGLTLLFSIKSAGLGFAEGLVPPEVLDSAAGGQVTKRQVLEANVAKHFVPMLWLWWLWVVAVLGTLWAALGGMVKARAVVWVALVAGVLDILRVDTGAFNKDGTFVKAVSARPYFSTERELAKLATGRPSDPFRCFSLPGALPQNSEGIHRLEGVGGFHDNELRWYRAFRGDQSDRNYYHGLIGQQPGGGAYLQMDRAQQGNAFLNLANVRYLLGRQSGRVVTIENAGALPRISFAPRYGVFDTTATVDSLRSPTFDYRSTVALLEAPADAPAPHGRQDSAAPAGAEVRWEKYTPNYRKAVVTAPDDGFLRISEVYYRGWEVRIDHTPVKVYQADCAFMAVAVKQGRHTVELWPRSLYLGTATAVSGPLVTAVVLFWVWMAARAWRRRWAAHVDGGPGA